MCIPSKANPQSIVFKGGDATFALNPNTQISSSSLFGDNQAARDEAFQSLQSQENMKHCVQHNYHDHANDDDAMYLEAPIITKGGVSVPFPMKLHNMLDHIDIFEPELSSIVRWQPHGRCFLVKNSKEFAASVLPRFFDQRKYASFQRQLNLYGFNRITAGPDKGSYYHELFLRSKKILCRGIHRMKIKGTGTRMASNPDQEPNFYVMESMPSASSLANNKEVQQGLETIEVVTPPLAIKSENDSSCEEMPALQLPLSSSGSRCAAPSSSCVETAMFPTSIDMQGSHTSSLSAPQNETVTVTDTLSQINNDTLGNPASLMKIENHLNKNSSFSDLSFVFGNMPFHSIDTTQPFQDRRNSFMAPISSSDDSSSTLTMEDRDDFLNNRELNNVVDIESKIDFSDQEMSQLLEKIVNHEVYPL